MIPEISLKIVCITVRWLQKIIDYHRDVYVVNRELNFVTLQLIPQKNFYILGAISGSIGITNV